MLPFCASFTKMKKPLESTFYNKWMIPPKLPNCLITFISGTEFICGSVPNLKSTRGLLFGAAQSGDLVFLEQLLAIHAQPQEVGVLWVLVHPHKISFPPYGGGAPLLKIIFLHFCCEQFNHLGNRNISITLMPSQVSYALLNESHCESHCELHRCTVSARILTSSYIQLVSY